MNQYRIVKEGSHSVLNYSITVTVVSYVLTISISYFILSVVKPYIVQQTDSSGRPTGDIDFLHLLGSALLYGGSIGGVIAIFAIISRIREKGF